MDKLTSEQYDRLLNFIFIKHFIEHRTSPVQIKTYTETSELGFESINVLMYSNDNSISPLDQPTWILNMPLWELNEIINSSGSLIL